MNLEALLIIGGFVAILGVVLYVPAHFILKRLPCTPG